MKAGPNATHATHTTQTTHTTPAASNEAEQGSLDLLMGAQARRVSGGRVVEGVRIAEHRPVARVAVALGLPLLDRLFDYLVPADLDKTAVPGVRVKVRFSGRDVDGFVVERATEAEHSGRLEPLRRVVSPEPVLTPAILALSRAVADSHVGTLDDVLRLAIPPRHATAERNLAPAGEAPAGEMPAVEPERVRERERAPESDWTPESERTRESERARKTGRTREPERTRGPETPGWEAPEVTPSPWDRYVAGPSFVRHLAAGRSPAAAWIASPSDEPALDWPAALAHAAAATLASGRGVVVVVPDRRDVERVDAEFARVLGPGKHVRLTADQGPEARYTAWLSALRGHVKCVVGTRAAAFAPVHDLGLVAWWSDGDDLLAEPRAPYPHVRDVLRMRREQEGCGLLVGGYTRTAPVQSWLEQGWIHAIGEDPAARRAHAAPVTVAGEGRQEEYDGPGAHARLPSEAWRVAKKALDQGPVLVQVPRRGYLPGLSCKPCGLAARCPDCHGPLAQAGSGASPTCRWCGTTVRRYECPNCGAGSLRASVVGAERTVEEVGRAFPGVPVRFSGGGDVLASVPSSPAIVVATPGAEPVAESGYAATLVLDAWASLQRPRLDAGEQALARWSEAAALTRSRRAGGRVVIAGVPDSPALGPVEAFVRLAPEWFAERELEERRGLDLPPLRWLAKVTGPLGALVDALAEAALSTVAPTARVLGPWPVPGDEAAAEGDPAERPAVALMTCAPAESQAVCAALSAMRAVRGAHKVPLVSVRVGDADLD